MFLPPGAFPLGAAPPYMAVSAYPAPPYPPRHAPPAFVPNFTSVPPNVSAPPYEAPAVSGGASSTSSFPGSVGAVSAGRKTRASPDPAAHTPIPSGWGLSVSSSPASSLASQPYYVVLQPPMAYAPLPHAVPLPPRAPPAPKYPTQDNGCKYVLGQWYEGVVKRYNPMRGFGFLTATHHLRQVGASVVETQTKTQTETQTKTQTKTQTETQTAERGSPTDGAEPEASQMQLTVVREVVNVGDIFVHQSYIQMQGFRALTVGERIFFRVGVLQGKDAHQAVDVQRVEDVLGPNAAKSGNASHNASMTEAEPNSSDSLEPQKAPSPPRTSTVEELLRRLSISGDSLEAPLPTLDTAPTRAAPTRIRLMATTAQSEAECSLPSPCFAGNSVGFNRVQEEMETGMRTPRADNASSEGEEICDFMDSFEPI